MEYRVVESCHLKNFQDEINRVLNNGWVCLGGVAVTRDNNGAVYYYVQALIRKKPEPDPTDFRAR